MKKLICISDTHLGAQRAAGTTPLTAWQLRQYLLEEFGALLDSADGADLFINGDWLDVFNIEASDLFATYGVVSEWLKRNPKSWLGAGRGNHDAAKNTTMMSSFDLLAGLLKDRFGERVKVFVAPGWVDDGVYCVYCIPHVANQELFDLALQSVPKCKYLLLHCNFHNNFATQSDHSLNLSLEQAMALPVEKIIIAHEHQHRTALNGKVLVPGNQFPASVADCLGNEVKYMTTITDGKVELVETWSRKGSYSEQDWRALKDDGSKFIRVVGDASAAEAADVVTTVSKFRGKSKALVITNAVQVEGVADGESIQVTLEQVKSFDVLGALLECLDEREQGVVKQLLERQACR